jgi:hypothetical protein
MSEVIKQDKWERADQAFSKGVEAYIEFGQECARLNAEGTTQQEIGNRYQMSQQQVGYALTVGKDERITSNTCTLPRSTYSLYLLTTLDDKGFDKLAKPDTTQADIKAYKEAQNPRKPKALSTPVKDEDEMKKEPLPKFNTVMNDTGLSSGKANTEAVLSIMGMSEVPKKMTPELVEKIANATLTVLSMRNPSKAKDDAQKAKDELSKSSQQKLDSAIKKWQAVVLADMQKQFNEQLAVAKAEVQLERDAVWALKREAEAERDAAVEYRKGIDSHMTQDEFRLIRSCLHADRVPDELKERFDKAFVIFNRLEKTVNTKQPIANLREKGWEKVSPFYKSN